MSPHVYAGFWVCCALVPFGLLADEPASADAASDPTKEFVIGKPITFRNLTLLPVSSLTPKQENRFITLDEAVKAGLVKIYEKGALPQDAKTSPSEKAPPGNEDPFADEGNDVNELFVVNLAKKPLYLMPGEIIIGGDQDRSIAEELIVPPTGKPVPLSVYCVERGRWGRRNEADYARIISATIASDDRPNGEADAEQQRASVEQTAKEANSGKFIGSVGSLGKGGRVAVSNKEGQGKVWEEVQAANAKAGVNSDSEAFSRNYSDEEVAKRLKPYLQALEVPLAEAENVVGVIVAMRGEVESLDIFESTPLFQKLWPKLLKSYALDAANAIDEETEDTVAKACDLEDALAFLKEVAESKAETEGTEIKADLATTRGENDRLLRFSAHERRGGGAAFGIGGLGGGIGGGGFFGGSVHGAAFKK